MKVEVETTEHSRPSSSTGEDTLHGESRARMELRGFRVKVSCLNLKRSA